MSSGRPPIQSPGPARGRSLQGATPASPGNFAKSASSGSVKSGTSAGQLSSPKRVPSKGAASPKREPRDAPSSPLPGGVKRVGSIAPHRKSSPIPEQKGLLPAELQLRKGSREPRTSKRSTVDKRSWTVDQPPGSATVRLSDYSQVDILGLRCISVTFGLRKVLVPPNC